MSFKKLFGWLALLQEGGNPSPEQFDATPGVQTGVLFSRQYQGFCSRTGTGMPGVVFYRKPQASLGRAA